MHRCPKCGTLAHAKQTRAARQGVRRRYHCPKCEHRFSTLEVLTGPDAKLMRDIDTLLGAA